MPCALDAVSAAIVACEACPRLRAYCTRVGREKRAAYRHDTYWARPVPGWGDPAARILLLGLAPAAHGANRTGRLFTGDVPGGSSDFLMQALHACGLASHPWSRAADDGVTLSGVWISAAVRCAPPDNAPRPDEVTRCLVHLQREWAALPEARVILALGRLAFDVARRLLPPAATARRPVFEHEGHYRAADGRTVVASYHPSRQNTQTGRLTQAMLRTAIRRAAAVASA
ncbi:MAG: hypothetical protein ABS36_07395 [Acidobacteria bacterium SCN 69-37]|nr:MAG: hypothetical protein ABS36_07395 [Acidobacteria bacterium SCN 69-37]